MISIIKYLFEQSQNKRKETITQKLTSSPTVAQTIKRVTVPEEIDPELYLIKKDTLSKGLNKAARFAIDR